MPQQHHRFQGALPLPMKFHGFLIEVAYDHTESPFLTTDHAVAEQLHRGWVRAASSGCDPDLVELLLPNGQGSIGAEVIVHESNFHYLSPDVYETFGLTYPKQTSQDDTGKLAFVSALELTGYVTEAGESALPFAALGTRVFIDFDFDDSKDLFRDGQINEDAVRVTGGGIAVPESALARRSNVATVIGVGHDAPSADDGGLDVGDRILAPAEVYAIEFGGKSYFYLGHPREAIAKVLKLDASPAPQQIDMFVAEHENGLVTSGTDWGGADE